MKTDNEEFNDLVGRPPRKPVSDAALIVKALTELGKRLEALNQDPPVVNVAAPQVSIPPIQIPKWDIKIPTASQAAHAPLKWEFTVERDADGRLSKIIATPQ